MSNWAKPRQRIDKLLTTWPELTHTFGFATGAIYALERADQRAMRDRRSYQEVDRPMHTQVVRDVLQTLDSGQEPAESWVAGFLYNSAIMRLDACYERFLEAITRELKQRGQLADPVAASGPRLSDSEKLARRIESSSPRTISLTRVHLEQNRKDVNRLKHRLFGREAAAERSKAIGDVEGAAAALDELLTILETPEIQQSLTGAYQALPPA